MRGAVKQGPPSRVPKPVPNARDDKVKYIAAMMRRLRWVRGKSGKRLAEEWGVSREYMKELAAEAWRRVRAEVTDPEQAQAIACAEFAAIIKDARLLRRDPAMMKIRIEAAKSLAVISGGAAPKKVVEMSRFDVLTPDQHRAELAKLRAEIEEEERRIDAAEGRETVQ